MSLGHGPKIITKGLVFAYDMGPNPGVNKSWKGQPVTNVVTNTNLNTGWSQGYNTDIVFNDYPPPNGINSQVVSFRDADGNGSGYWYSYGNYAPQSPSTTYAVSVYARTVGSGTFSIRPYTADNSETGRQNLNILTVPNDGKWHRLEFDIFTTPSNTQSDSLSFSFTSITANKRCWLCAPQMTATSYHVPFVAGTRSNTQALLDWTGNYTLTASSGVIYNSDGTFSFTTTANTSYFDLNSQNIISGTNPFTIEAWTNKTSGTLGEIFGNYGSGYTSGLWFATAGLYIAGSVYHTDYGNSMAGKHHSAVTRDSSGNVKLYRDGVLVNTGTLTSSIPSNINFRIGADVNSGGEALGGNIYSVKVYNTVLTAAEVQQNFQALRGRYGI